MPSPALNDQYKLGLSNIRKAIETHLVDAGAQMSLNSVYFQTKQSRGGRMPTNTCIAAVPLDAPRFMVDFTQQEVLDCSEGVDRGGISEKIRLYSAAYAKFRGSSERTTRADKQSGWK